MSKPSNHCMRSGGLRYPARDGMLVLHQSVITAAGSPCGGALLSFFEDGHSTREAILGLEESETPDVPGLLQRYTDFDLRTGLLDMFGDQEIKEAVKALKQKGFISEHPEGSQRFLFHPDVVDAIMLENSIAAERLVI